MVVAKLSPDYTAFTGEYYAWTDGSVEGPAMFKRAGVYYITVGPGCCACRGGSDVIVYTAASALGPYVERGSVGRNVSQPVFNAHSPYNYATRAQQTKVVPVPNGSGGVSYLWAGNQWVTAGASVGYARNFDLMYWSVLNFTADGNITQISWSDTTTLVVA